MSEFLKIRDLKIGAHVVPPQGKPFDIEKTALHFANLAPSL